MNHPDIVPVTMELHPLLVAIKTALVDPCFRPNETYSESTRKYAVISCALMAINAITLGIPLLVISEMNTPSLGSRLSVAFLFQTSITSSIAPYLYMRSTKSIPQWLVDLQMWGTLPTVVCVILFVPDAPCSAISVIAALAAIVMRIRMLGLFVFIQLCLYVVSGLLTQFYDKVPRRHRDTAHVVRKDHVHPWGLRLHHCVLCNRAPRCHAAVRATVRRGGLGHRHEP